MLQRPTKLVLCPQERTDSGSSERLLNATPAAVLPISDVIEMGQFVADMTKAIQAQHIEYQKRYREFFAKREAEKAAEEKRDRERREAMEAEAKADAQLESSLAKEKRFAEETARMDRELGLTDKQNDNGSASAGAAGAGGSGKSASAAAAAMDDDDD